MNILSTVTTGEFIFIVGDKYEQVTFTDDRDIPDDFEFKFLIKFVPNIPEPPHNAQQHAEIAEMHELFKHYMEKSNASGN